MEDEVQNPERLITGNDQLTPDKIKAIDNKMASVTSPYYIEDKGDSGYTIDQPSFAGYIPQEQMFGNLDLENIRAINQSTIEQAWNATRRIIPKMAVGLVEQVGYLGEGVKYGLEAITGNLEAGKIDFSNALTEWAQGAKQTLDEGSPIYREDPNAVFDLDDPAWWFDHGSNLVESVGEFFALGYGVGGITRGVTKGITSGFVKSAQWLKYAKLGRFGAKMESVMNTVAPSVALAYAEGAMSGATVYDDIYQLGIAKVNEEYIDEEGNITDEDSYNAAVERVRREAGLAAAKTTAINTAIVSPLNFTSISALGGFKWKSRGFLKSLREEDNLMTWGKLWGKAAGVEAPKEGIEEVVNLVAEKFGMQQGKENLNILSPEERKSAIDLIIDTALSEEGFLNFMLGAVGGIGQTVATQGAGNTKLGEKLGIGETFEQQNQRKKDAIKAALENNAELQKIVLDYVNGKITDDTIEHFLSVDQMEEATDLMDHRIFQLYLSAMNSGTAEFIEEKMNALEKDADEDYKPLFQEIKNDLKKTEKFYNEGMALYGDNYALAVPEYVHDRLRLRRNRTDLTEAEKDYQTKRADYKNTVRPNIESFIETNKLNITSETLLNYLLEEENNAFTAELSNEQKTLIDNLKEKNKIDLSIDTTLKDVLEARVVLSNAERNHNLSVNSFNKNWFNDTIPARIHNLKQQKIDEFLEREKNKNALQEDKDKNKAKSKEDPITPKDPNDQIVEEEEDDVIEFSNEETEAANESQLEINATPKSKKETEQDEQIKKEKEKQEREERQKQRKKAKEEREKKTSLDNTNNPTDNTVVEEPEIKPTQPNVNNINPPIEPTIEEKPYGESVKKKKPALSIANRALNVNIVNGFVETAYDEEGNPSFNETSKEATAILAKPFNGVLELSFEVDESYKVGDDTFGKRSNDPNRLPIKISIKGVEIGYMHDTDIIGEGVHKGKNRLELHIYDDEFGNLQYQIELLQGVRKRIFDEYKKTGAKSYKTTVSNSNKSDGTIIKLKTLTSLKDAFNGAPIQIGVVRDSSNSIRTRDGVHKTSTTNYVPAPGSVVAILPSARSGINGKTGGITRYLKQNTVEGIRDQDFSEGLKNLMIDFITGIVTKDESFLSTFLDNYGKELNHLSDNQIKLTNDLKTFKLLAEMFFYVQDDLDSKLGKKLFHINSKTQMIWMNPTEGLSIKDLKKAPVNQVRQLVNDYVRANIDNKYFTVNAKMLGQQIAYPTYSEDGKLIQAKGKVDYERDFLSDTGILEADFKGLKLDDGSVVFYTDSVIEYGLPELIESKNKKKESKQDPEIEITTTPFDKTKGLITKIRENQKLVQERTADYYLINGKRYKRVSNVIPNDFDGDTSLYENSRVAGSKVDSIVRDYFNNSNKINPDGISQEAFDNLLKALDRLKPQDGERFLADNLVVWDDVNGVAGELDILSIKPDGSFGIKDIKTMKDYSKYDSRYKDKQTKREQHSNQLTAYSNIIRNQYGIEISEMEIIPFEIGYNSNGYIQELRKKPNITLERSSLIDILIPINEAGVIPNQVAPNADDLFGSIDSINDSDITFANIDEDDIIEFSSEETSAANNSQLTKPIQETERLINEQTEEVKPIEQPIVEVLDSLVRQEQNDYFIQVGLDGNNQPLYLNQQQQIDIVNSFTNTFINQLYTGKSANEAFENVKKNIKTFADRCNDRNNEGFNPVLGKIFNALYESFDAKDRAGVKSLIINNLPSKGLKLTGNEVKTKKSNDPNLLVDTENDQELTDEDYILDEISQGQNNKFGNDSAAQDIFNKASQKVRRLISFLKVPEKVEAVGEMITYKKNWAGLPLFLDSNKVYHQLLHAIGDSQSLQEMKDRLWDMSRNGRTDMYAVLLNLNAADNSVQNEFYSVLAQQYNTYAEVTRSTNKKTQTQTFKRQDKNRNLATSPIVDNWNNNAKLLLYKNVDGKPVLNIAHINSIGEDLKALRLKAGKGWDKKTFDENKETLGRILRSIGININDRFLNDYYRYFSNKTVRRNPINKADNKVYPAFASTLDNILYIIEDLKKGEYDNPFKEASGRMYELAEVEFLGGEYDVNSSFRMHKKGYYSYNSPFALRDLTDKLKNDEYYVRDLINTPYSSTSYWLKSLYFGEGIADESQLRFIRNFDAVILGGVRHTTKGNRSTEISDLSPREREIANVNMLMQGFKFDSNFVMNGTGYWVFNTISDKTTLPMLPVNLLPTIDGSLSGRLLDELYESGVQSELNRMQLVNKQVNSTDSSLPNDERVLGFHYGKEYGDQKGLGFFFLNFDALNNIPYIFDNRLNESITSTPEYRKTVKDAIVNIIDKQTTKKIEDWKFQNLIEGSGESMKLTDNFDNNAKQNIRTFLGRVGVNPTTANVATYAAMFYEASSQLMSYNLRQITEDPATAGKPVFNNGVFNLNASIKATWDNVNKRNAKWIAPGLRGNHKDPFYIQVIVADSESKLSEYNPKEYGELINVLNNSSLNDELRQSVLSKYEEINNADAQEVTTIREHLGNLLAYGMIDDNQYKIASRILVKDNPSIDDFEELNALGIVLEPFKPVYSRSLIENGHNLPKYIKTSSFPLIPFLTKGTKWDKVRKKMEALEKEKNIPVRLTFKSGAKLGIKSKPINLFDKDGNVLDDADLSQSMIILDRQGLYLQQQPQEPKNEITQGTQETILNLQNFESHDKDGNEYVFDLPNGLKVKGSELVNLYNGVHSRIIEKSFDKLLNRLNAKKTTDKDGNIQYKIDSIGELRDTLVQELKNRGIGLNSISSLTTLVDREVKQLDKLYKEKIQGLEDTKEIDDWFNDEIRKLIEKDRFLLPLILHPQSKKLESVMMSLITNGAIRLKLPGTSGILGTEMGFELDKKEKYNFDGIAWVDRNRTGPLAKNEIILSWWFGKDFEEKTRLYNLYKEGKVSIKDLETMFGFRIPTGSPSFTSDFKVAGFFPPIMGSLTVPSRRVTIAMGSDFDVDTLKLYQHNYIVPKDRDGNIKFDENGNVVISKVSYNLNINELSKSQLQNLAIDLRIALATHPSRQLYRVLPNAYGDFKTLAEQFQSEIDPETGLNAMSTISDRNAFFDGQGGKSGVARFSLMVVGHTKAQLAKLYIKDFGGGIKFLNEDGSLIEEENWKKEDYSFIDEDSGEEYKPSGLWRLDKIYSTNNNLISNILQYLQSGAVDNVKELILRANHINKETFGVAGLLAQVGLNEEQIVYFLKQPVIVDYVSQLIKLGDSFNETYNPNEKQEIANRLFQQYVGIPRNAGSEIVGFSLTNLKEMLNDATLNSSVIKYNEAQGDILNAFLYYNELATSLNRVMSEYRQEAKGAGKSVIENIRINDNFDAVNNITSIGNKSNLNNLYYKTLQEVIEQTESLYSSTLNNNPVLHNYSNIFRETTKNIYAMTGRTSFNERFTNDIHNAITSYLLTALRSITSDSIADRLKLTTGTLDTIVDQYQILPDIIKQNKFLKQLQFYRTEEGFSVVKNDNGKIVDNIDDIHTAFIELLTSSNPEVNRFAKNLVKYSFVTGGNPFNPTGFHKYIPASYLIDNKIGEDFYNLNLESINYNFYEQFFQNNPNYTIGFKLGEGVFKAIDKEKTLIKLDINSKNKEIVSRYVNELADGTNNFIQFINEYDPKAKSYKLYKLIDDQGTYQLIKNYYDLPIEMGDIYDFNRPIKQSVLETVAPTEQQKQSVVVNNVTKNFNFNSGITATELVNILKQETKNPAQLIVLDALSQRSDLGKVIVRIEETKIAGARAEFNSTINTITINPNLISSDKTAALKTLLEELVHAATVSRITASIDPNSSERVLYDRAIKIKKTIEAKINEEYQDKFKQIKILDPNNTGTDYISAMRYYFDKAYAGESLKDQSTKLPKELTPLINEGRKIVYPIYNEFEFIAHSLSNNEFQDYLKSQKYSGDKSIFEKILDLIAELLFSIGGNKTFKEIYGDIDETVFRQALEVAFSYTIGTSQQEFKKQIEEKQKAQDKKAEVKLEIKKSAKQTVRENINYDPTSGYELFPGVFTNQKQTEGINLVSQFLKDPNAEVFVLTGKGGTGKTTILNKVIEVNNIFSYRGAAVSHAAVENLGNSIGQDNSMTLAALLGIKFNEETGEFTPDLFARSKGIPIQKANLIIIDEMSMVSDELFDEIMNLKKKSAKVIFTGDYRQLKPIGQDTLSKSFKAANEGYELNLVDIMRQGEQSPIISITDKIADHIDNGTPKLHALGLKARVTNYNKEKDEGVIFTNDNEKAFENFIIDLKRYSNDPKAVKMVTFNNHKHNAPESVKSLNNEIRKRLFGSKVSSEFQLGELVVAYDTFNPTQQSPIFYNSQSFYVREISTPEQLEIVAKGKDGVKVFSFMVNNITIEDEKGNKHKVPVIAASDIDKYDKTIKELFSKKETNTYAYRVSEKIANLKAGYAITSHKAQGSTYRNAYVFEDNILNGSQGTNLEKNNALYTATTRPSKKLVMIGINNKIDEEAKRDSFASLTDTIFDVAQYRMNKRLVTKLC